MRNGEFGPPDKVEGGSPFIFVRTDAAEDKKLNPSVKT